MKKINSTLLRAAIADALSKIKPRKGQSLPTVEQVLAAATRRPVNFPAA